MPQLKAHGCRVLGLDFAHEACGDAALYFDPWDTGSIRDSILRLMNDPEIAAELVEKGKARAEKKHRSWDEIVHNLLDTLSAIVEETRVS